MPYIHYSMSQGTGQIHFGSLATGCDSTLLGYPERLLLVSWGLVYSFGKGVAGRNLHFVNPWGWYISTQDYLLPLSRDVETSEAYTKSSGWVPDLLICVLTRTATGDIPFQPFPQTCTKSLVSLRFKHLWLNFPWTWRLHHHVHWRPTLVTKPSQLNHTLFLQFSFLIFFFCLQSGLLSSGFHTKFCMRSLFLLWMLHSLVLSPW